MKIKKLRAMMMNLQLFADGEGDGAAGNGSGTGDGAGGEGNADDGTGSFDDFLKDPKNQAEFDRRVAKALGTQKAKLDGEYADAKKEAEKLAKMNAEQRRQYEMDKLRKENEDLKKANMRIELGSTASSLLKEHDIDATQDILEFVVGDDADTTNKNIDKFVKIIEAQVKKAELARATGTTPRNIINNGNTMTEIDRRIAKYK